jgi:glycine/D-amino acid oxidase-like deaminating enzyme
MSQLPSSVHAVVIGAGIHGLSTGWHLGLELERRRRGRFATGDRHW